MLENEPNLPPLPPRPPLSPRIKIPKVPVRDVVRYFRSSILLLVFTVFLVCLALVATIRVQRVSGSEIGVRVNNLTGEVTPITQSGTMIYNGILTSFYVMDRTEQRMEMTVAADRGERQGKDDLRIKTTDGNDVFLDLTINYCIMLDQLDSVIKSSGVGDLYKTKWIRDYARSICRTIYGELTTEQFYNASERNKKATEAQDEMNKHLNPHGIMVTKVIAEDFRFHDEYLKKVREKKLADQGMLEERSKANAAREDQVVNTTRATKEKEVRVKSYEGEMKKLIVAAEAQADRALKEAESYAIKTQRDADAQYVKSENNAKALLAKGSTEAEGMRRMAEALQGAGGRNLVKLGYAERLQQMSVSGQPFQVNSQTERFSHVEEQPAAPQSAAPEPKPQAAAQQDAAASQ
jgi:regulator of protease activity HflC (stomatin/prohibitin superfamily)